MEEWTTIFRQVIDNFRIPNSNSEILVSTHHLGCWVDNYFSEWVHSIDRYLDVNAYLLHPRILDFEWKETNAKLYIVSIQRLQDIRGLTIKNVFAHSSDLESQRMLLNPEVQAQIHRGYKSSKSQNEGKKSDLQVEVLKRLCLNMYVPYNLRVTEKEKKNRPRRMIQI